MNSLSETPVTERGDSQSLKESVFFSTLNDERIVTHFQPILSIKNGNLLGFEALSRPIGPDGEQIMPSVFFEAARHYNQTLEIDRLCRSRSLSAFRGILAALPPEVSPLVFINIDTSILDQGVAGSGVLLGQVAKEGLSPDCVVIEIVESSVKNTQALQEFTSFYRQKGFLIALDDVGSGHSNFDRFTVIKPDIIKVDRSIISEIHKDFYKQETFKALIQLSRRIGSLVLAEGVETEEEALCVLNCGADLLQGYFFARPAPTWDLLKEQMGSKSRDIANKLRDYKVGRINNIRNLYRQYNDTLAELCRKLADVRPDCFEAELVAIIQEISYIEAVYVLNKNGVMITDTVLRTRSRHKRSKLFQMAQKGDDLSQKDYFYLLIFSGLKHYSSDSYTSLATGNLTRTISCLFECGGYGEFILCIDVLGDFDACPC